MNAKNNTNNIGREEKLKSQLNNFFVNFGIDDIYSKIIKNPNGLIQLKQIVSCVNNIITLKATESFVKKLEDDKVISDKIAAQIRQKISKQSANANGYDVQYDNGNIGEKKIIAEVKCNIRASKNSYGSKQKEGINNDIKYLKEGKKTAKLTKEDVEDYYKFFVILDNDISRNYIEGLIKGDAPLIEYTGKGCLNAKDCVYVVYVKI